MKVQEKKLQVWIDGKVRKQKGKFDESDDDDDT